MSRLSPHGADALRPVAVGVAVEGPFRHVVELTGLDETGDGCSWNSRESFRSKDRNFPELELGSVGADAEAGDWRGRAQVATGGLRLRRSAGVVVLAMWRATGERKPLPAGSSTRPGKASGHDVPAGTSLEL